MADDKKEKLPIRVSARGTAKRFSKLQTPDEEYDNFQVKLTWAPDDEGYEWAQSFIAEVDEMIEAALVSAKKSFKPTKDKKKFGKEYADKPYQVDDETGEITINFKKAASYTKNKGTSDETIIRTSLPFFDAKGNKIPKNPDLKIGEGSELKVAFTVEGFYKPIGASASIKLYSAKLLSLVEWEGGGEAADYFGDEAEEDGFEVGAAASTDADDPDAAEQIDDPEPVEDEGPTQEELDAAAEKAAKLAAKKAPAAKPVAKPVKTEVKGKPVVAPAVAAASAAKKAAAKPKAEEGADNGDF